MQEDSTSTRAYPISYPIMAFPYGPQCHGQKYLNLNDWCVPKVIHINQGLSYYPILSWHFPMVLNAMCHGQKLQIPLPPGKSFQWFVFSMIHLCIESSPVLLRPGLWFHLSRFSEKVLTAPSALLLFSGWTEQKDWIKLFCLSKYF